MCKCFGEDFKSLKGKWVKPKESGIYAEEKYEIKGAFPDKEVPTLKIDGRAWAVWMAEEVFNLI